MMETLKKMLGINPEINFAELYASGALIVDVRSHSEFEDGSIKGSVNIPMLHLEKNLDKLKKYKIIITCCAGGVRSGTAKNILKSHGFTEVYNGGKWESLAFKIRYK
jgi:phage shock protein E